MAWAEKQASGKYRAMYRDAAGKRRSAGTFTHKAEAVRKGGAAEEKARKQTWLNADASRRTWGEWADEWWPSRDLAASTLKVDADRRRKHLDPRWGDVQIGKITRQEVRNWLAELRASGMSTATATRCVHLLSASLNGAVDAEVIEVNPALRLKPVDKVVGKSTRRFITEAEYVELRRQMPTERDALILEILILTGIRWGELAGAHAARVETWQETDESGERVWTGVLSVQETWDSKNQIMKAGPKSRRTRLVELPAYLAERLSRLPKSDSLRCGYEHEDNGHCPGPLLITGAKGGVLGIHNWSYRVFKPAVEAANLGKVRVHDLRHSYASWLVQAGVPLAMIGDSMGHLDYRTTQGYAHQGEKPDSVIARVMQGKIAS